MSAIRPSISILLILCLKRSPEYVSREALSVFAWRREGGGHIWDPISDTRLLMINFSIRIWKNNKYIKDWRAMFYSICKLDVTVLESPPIQWKIRRHQRDPGIRRCQPVRMRLKFGNTRWYWNPSGGWAIKTRAEVEESQTIRFLIADSRESEPEDGWQPMRMTWIAMPN
jgi:hypothetical protein